MPSVFIEDFKFGMDRRRPRYSGVPGTLWEGRNVHLSRGGDIERSKRFAPAFAGLTNTFGLIAVDSQLYVFGSADLAGSMPVGVVYQRLQSPAAAAMTRVLSAKLFDNKIYAIAEYADGTRYHFYNGTRVSTWDTVANGLATAAVRARALALKVGLDPAVNATPEANGVLLTASVPGTAFTITAAAANGGGVNDQTANVTTLQANVAGVAEVRATATVTITGGSFDPNVNVIVGLYVGTSIGTAVNLLPSPVSWVNSNAATASAVAQTINDGTAGHGYSAVAVGSDLTISAIVGSGAAANAYFAFPVADGAVVTSGDVAFTGGVTAVAAVAQVSRVTFGGTFEALDTLTITVNGQDYKTTGQAAATGLSVHVEGNRVWSVAGAAVAYCKLNDPTDWTDATVGTGAGKIVLSTDSGGAQMLTGIAPYQSFAAIFSETTILIYNLGVDPAAFERVQEIPNTGTLAGRAVVGYGANDVFYLDVTGIRSLQARDSSNAAFVNDVGTVFDSFVQETLATVAEQSIYDAVSIIEPTTGSYWLAVEGTIFVLSNFPGTGVRGWTYYAPPFTVTGATVVRDAVYVRSATDIYLYGGASGAEYPLANEMVARVRLPFLTARDDSGVKTFVGLDLGAANEWHVTGMMNPNDATVTLDLGRYVGVTYSDENAEIDSISSHLALDLECDRAGFASLSTLALHHTGSVRR